MAISYSYPRVEVKTTALKHSSSTPVVEDTTVLFAPICTEKGPSGVVTPIHSLTELISTFGELSYKQNGQMALNIYNWLTNYGTVYVYRMNGKTEYGAKVGNSTVLKAKYGGTYYSNMYIELYLPSDIRNSKETDTTKIKSTTIYIDVYLDNTKVETLTLTPKTYKSIIGMSEYIKDADFSSIIDTTNGKFKITRLNKPGSTEQTGDEDTGSTEYIYKIDLSDVTDNDKKVSNISTNYTSGHTKITFITTSTTTIDNTSDAACLESFWKSYAKGAISNTLEFPIDIVMDAGYPEKIKKAMMDALVNSASSTQARDDVILIMDRYVLNNIDTTNSFTEKPSITTDTAPAKAVESTSFSFTYSDHMALYDQYLVEYDGTFSSENIYVTPTYYLSKLLPYNDETYGIQAACAGIRRAILASPIKLYTNLTPDQKNQDFNDRINYIEKTSRETAFMGQRTYDNSTQDTYTALSFLNNVRVLERMKKDIVKIGRQYLFEFNDSVTLAQLSTVLNRYVTEWISNRTLAAGVVTVEASPYSDEAVVVTLSIRFNGTIEVITVDITIE